MKFIRMFSLFCVLGGIAFGQVVSNGAIPQVTPGVVTHTVDRMFGETPSVSSTFHVSAVGVNPSSIYMFTAMLPPEYQGVVTVDPKGAFIMVGQSVAVTVTIKTASLPLGNHSFVIMLVGQNSTWSITPRVDVQVINSLYPTIGTPQETDRFVPHVAAGKNWTTVIRILNPSDSEVKTYTMLQTQQGNPLELNVNGFVLAAMPHVIAPNSVVQMVVTSTKELEMGNAIVKTISGPTPNVTVLYKQLSPTRHSAVQILPTASSKLMYYDTRGRQSFGMAVGNNSLEAKTVVLEFLNLDGTLVKAEAFVVPARGSHVLTVDLDYPSVSNTEGLVRVKADVASLSVFGLQFDLDSESFSSEN